MEKQFEMKANAHRSSLSDAFNFALKEHELDEFPFSSHIKDFENFYSSLSNQLNQIDSKLDFSINKFKELDLLSKKTIVNQKIFSIFIQLQEDIQNELINQTKYYKQEEKNFIGSTELMKEEINQLKNEIKMNKTENYQMILNLRNINDSTNDIINSYVNLQKKLIQTNQYINLYITNLQELKKNFEEIKQFQIHLSSQSTNLQTVQNELSKEAITITVNINDIQKMINEKKSFLRAKLLELTANETNIKSIKSKIEQITINRNEALNNLEEINGIIEERNNRINENIKTFDNFKEKLIEKQNEFEHESRINSENIKCNEQLKEKLEFLELQLDKSIELRNELFGKIEKKKLYNSKLKETLLLRSTMLSTEINNKEHLIDKISRSNHILEEKHNFIIDKSKSLKKYQKEFRSPSIMPTRSYSSKFNSKLFPVQRNSESQRA